jgi:hypothetical protein
LVKFYSKSKTSGKGIIIPSSAIQGTENQPQVLHSEKWQSPFAKTSLYQIRYRTKQLFSSGLNEGDVIVNQWIYKSFLTVQM